MDRGIDVPTPGCGRQPCRHLRCVVPHVVCFYHRLWRRCRMEVEWDPELFRTLQDRPEEHVVQVAAPRVAFDHRALEAVLAHRALQLVCGGLRGRGWQRGEPGETAQMASYRLRQAVVRLAGERRR